MKNKSPVKAVAQKKQGTPKQAKSPINKAKNAMTPKSPKSPKNQNGTPKSPKQQNGNENGNQKGKKKEKLNKMPVMNEPSDSEGSDSEPTNNGIAKFGGTAALNEATPQEKKAKKNKSPPQSSEAEVDADETTAAPAKKAKTTPEAKKTQKKEGANKKERNRIGIVKTIQTLMKQKDVKELVKHLPAISDAIEKCKNLNTNSARRKLRMLTSYEKKIKTGHYEPANLVAKRNDEKKQKKSQPKVPKEVLNMTQDSEESDEGETWQDKIKKVKSDEEDDEEPDKTSDVDNDEDDDEEEDEEEEKPKAPKGKKGKTLEVVKKAEDKTLNTKQGDNKKKRFVLFVGNLSYETNESQIEEHFAKAGKTVSIRLGKDKQTNKSKGFAHVEFDNEESYQKALSMHHTQLDKRQINVMYSTGDNKNSPQGNKKNNPKVKDMKLKGMKNKGLLAGSNNDSQKRSQRRKKAAGKNE